MTMKLGMNNLWPTPVLYGQVENKLLLERVCSAIFGSVNLHAPPNDFQATDVLMSDEPALTEFREQIVLPQFAKYLSGLNVNLPERSEIKLRSWITGCKNGYMIAPHNHSGASVSAVFYLMCDDSSSGREIYLMDPRVNANRGYTDEFKHLFKDQQLTPVSGDFVIFPSFLYHYTLPFNGNIRLAMPVDLFVVD